MHWAKRIIWRLTVWSARWLAAAATFLFLLAFCGAAFIAAYRFGLKVPEFIGMTSMPGEMLSIGVILAQLIYLRAYEWDDAARLMRRFLTWFLKPFDDELKRLRTG